MKHSTTKRAKKQSQLKHSPTKKHEEAIHYEALGLHSFQSRSKKHSTTKRSKKLHGVMLHDEAQPDEALNELFFDAV